MYQLNKQLSRLGVPLDKKDPVLKETIDRLLTGQKKRQTARALFGTPAEYAKELRNPEPTPVETSRQSVKLLAIDNILIFSSVFTSMSGSTSRLSSAATQTRNAGSSGITAILIAMITGGLILGYVATQVQPQIDKNGKWVGEKPSWQRILLIAARLAAWLIIYMLVSVLPNVTNSRFNPWIYTGIGVITFIGDTYFGSKLHVTGSLYGDRAPRR